MHINTTARIILAKLAQTLRRTPARIMVLVMVFSIAVPTVHALDPLQKKLFDNQVLYFNYKAEDGNCGGTGGGPTAANLTVGKDFNLGSDGKSRRVNLMKTLITDYGLSPVQAAGILGNFMREAGDDIWPDVNQGGRRGPSSFSGGYGWAQWTGPRNRSFVAFGVAGGYMGAGQPATDAANYAYLKDELSKGYKSTIPDLKQQNTLESAIGSWERTFEKAGVPAIADRIGKGRQALQEYMGAAGGGTLGTVAPGGGGTVDPACPQDGGLGLDGNAAFPLKTTKKGVNNPGIFKNGTTDKGSHPYTAFDIYANTGTEVVALYAGNVTWTGVDRCPGSMVSIYSPAQDMTISYLHMSSNHIKKGDTVQPGQHVGQVGSLKEACDTITHLHIDAAKGKDRPGCSRLNCPAANAAQFVDIGPILFKTYQALPN